MYVEDFLGFFKEINARLYEGVRRVE